MDNHLVDQMKEAREKMRTQLLQVVHLKNLSITLPSLTHVGLDSGLRYHKEVEERLHGSNKVKTDCCFLFSCSCRIFSKNMATRKNKIQFFCRSKTD